MRNGQSLDGIALVAYPYNSTRILVRFESPQLTLVATQASPKSVISRDDQISPRLSSVEQFLHDTLANQPA